LYLSSQFLPAGDCPAAQYFQISVSTPQIVDHLFFILQVFQHHLKLPLPSIFEGLDSFARQMHFPLASVRIPHGVLFIS
jgi:hypothetical protein